MEFRTSDGVLFIEPDAIYIRTSGDDKLVDNNEVVSWNIDEVREDPSLAFNIAYAVARFFTEGVGPIATSIGQQIDTAGNVTVSGNNFQKEPIT